MKYIYIVILCLFMCSCSGADPELTLAQAEAALRDGDVELAISNCQALSGKTSDLLAPDQLCRLALVYCKADDGVYADTVASLLSRAASIDAESVDRFVGGLSIEDQSAIQPFVVLIAQSDSSCGDVADVTDGIEETDIDFEGQSGDGTGE